MKNITLEELLEAGCHFGHQVTRQNPKAREYIFEARDGIHIIDLGLTKKGLEDAGDFLKSLASQEGSTLVIVGSKRQAQPIVQAEVKRAKETLKEKNTLPAGRQVTDGLFTVTNRWIGGTLTNFSEVTKNYEKLHDLESRLKDEFERSKYTKKEVGMWEKERQKLELFYGGIADMKKLPDAIFVIDTHLENLAVREANRMGVPAVGIVDTNADPEPINYPIPANDDAVGSLQLIISYIVDAWIEGKTDSELRSKNSADASTSAKASVDKKEENISVHPPTISENPNKEKPKKTRVNKTITK